MKYLLFITLLTVSPGGHAQYYKQIQGVWKSYNRPDTMTIAVTDTLIYFISPGIPELHQNVFRFWVMNNDGQLMLDLQPPHSDADIRYWLWISEKEIKVQKIDPRYYDNPKPHMPKETNGNTFRLRRFGYWNPK